MKKLFSFVVTLLVSLSAMAQTSTDYLLESLSPTDTYLRSLLPSNSFGSEQNLITGGWGDTYITLSKFSISSLPAIAVGDKVSVWFYNKNLGGASTPTQVNMGLSGSDFTNAWTWNNGASWYPSTVRAVNVNPYGYWTEFDITDYYNYWKNNVVPNYGIVMSPVNVSNTFNFFQSAESSAPVGQKPLLRITRPLQLKWPLSTPYASRHVNQAFGADWFAGGSYCPANVIKTHAGTDYTATAGDPIYAAEAGVVKLIINGGSWAYAMVLEHTKSDGSKYTTVYWHNNPLLSEGVSVSKGVQIATVANLGSNTHFHFGIRNGAYYVNGTNAAISGVGALPKQNCTDPNGKFYPGFSELFLDPENLSLIHFQ